MKMSNIGHVASKNHTKTSGKLSGITVKKSWSNGYHSVLH